MPANFKTYEAQSRLLAAVVATLPEKYKFDFKAMAAFVDSTASGLEHRFRHIKKQAKVLNSFKEQGLDPMKIDTTKIYDTMTDEEIHRLFGDSTPDGLSWQMREVKANGKKLKDAAAKGENPATALDGNLGSAVKRTPGARKRKTVIKPESDLDDLSDDDFTPTKAAAKKARIVQAKAANTMAATPSTPVHRTTAQAQPYTPATSTTVPANSAVPASDDLTEVAESAAATVTSPDTISRLGSMPPLTQGHGSPTELQSTTNTPGAFSAPYEKGVSMQTILQPSHHVQEESNPDPGNFGLSSGIGSAEQFNKGLSEIDQRYEEYMPHEPYSSAGLGEFFFDEEGAI